MNDDLFALVVTRYATLSRLLDDFMTACEMEPCEERNVLIQSIKERTNHNGLHFSPSELVKIFIGDVPSYAK